VPMRVISRDPQKLHVISDDGNITHDDIIWEHISRVNRRQRGDGRRVRMIKKKEQRLGPSSEPSICSLKVLSRKDKAMQCRKGHGKDGRVIHGFDHCDW
jgi:hypothetical protein